MSSRRRRYEPPWARPAAIAVALIIAALVAVVILRGLLSALGLTRSRRGVETDPQFAQPAQTVTRPPELDEAGSAADPEDDPSASWDLGEQTPVDKTAGELAREAEAAN